MKQKKTHNYIEILEDCAKIAKERQEQYGEATQSIKLACNILYQTFGIKLTGRQLCEVIIALKLSRNKFQHKKDSSIDIINYMCIGITCEEQNI